MQGQSHTSLYKDTLEIPGHQHSDKYWVHCTNVLSNFQGNDATVLQWSDMEQNAVIVIICHAFCQSLSPAERCNEKGDECFLQIVFPRCVVQSDYILRFSLICCISLISRSMFGDCGSTNDWNQTLAFTQIYTTKHTVVRSFDKPNWPVII